ncbi:hypothetical protein B0H16DRAFT_1740279 [Mycena metata]|uniref:Uncharacterized protein n=1 Tax=Mycena metata TaxID=1033252 RepID=A0AAD7HDI4_9AGAR|nr:hypothetical protein B0H16DRAFT_1740279 [Mycena metata]
MSAEGRHAVTVAWNELLIADHLELIAAATPPAIQYPGSLKTRSHFFWRNHRVCGGGEEYGVRPLGPDVCRMPIYPVDASPDLWPNLWLNFFHPFRDYLPVTSGTAGCFLHATIILSLAGHGGTSTLIRWAPGVRRILVLAWSILGDRFFKDFNRKEIVDVVGGTIHDLALITTTSDAPLPTQLIPQSKWSEGGGGYQT